VQHYKCLNCGKQFQSKRRPKRFYQKIWKEHVWQRQTIADLKNKYACSGKTMRTFVDRASVRQKEILSPQEVVCVFDATHIGDEILLVARAPELGANLGWAWIESETKEAYAGLRRYVESKGFCLKAVVLDGRTGIPKVFSDIMVQICQFHQLQTVKRKLTLRPETEAGQELLSIAFSIAKKDEKTLEKELSRWFAKYEKFINEKTYPTGSRRWRYTHRRVRSAYQSLKRNLSFLYTYQKYPELKIPNTTNSLDGYWSRLKNLLGAHRGKNKERMKKIVTEILRKQTA
jgi:hypothetical protein